MAALVVQQDRLVASGKANLIAAWFVVDRSGSMAGRRWQLTQSGVRNCLGQLTDSDIVGLLTFNETVQAVAIGKKSDINTRPFFSMSPSGGTALYDAIAVTLMRAIPLHLELTKTVVEAGISSQLGVVTYVIVLTDGEDTSSKESLASTRAALAAVNRLNNFKVLLAGVSLGAAAASSMRSLGAVGDSDIEFRDLRSDADIAGLFEHVSVQLRMVRQTVVVGLGGGGGGPARAAPAASLTGGAKGHGRGPRCALTLAGGPERLRLMAPASSAAPSARPPSAAPAGGSSAHKYGPRCALTLARQGPQVSSIRPTSTTAPAPAAAASPRVAAPAAAVASPRAGAPAVSSAPRAAVASPRAAAPAAPAAPEKISVRTVQLIEPQSLRWASPAAHSRCNHCYDSFGMFKWKYNCRMCGSIFCDNHCQKLRIRGNLERICPGCRSKLTD